MKKAQVGRVYLTNILGDQKLTFNLLEAVLRIRDVYPGSRVRLFFIPDSGSELSPSRILIKELKYFNPSKKGF
jgi:hypothetical protein